ncbi:MAG: DUF2281 domain-containing protein [Caldilinea sp. CFX5]|nr:DUF2281 domain-containing protein [Caldilinea sp. CFX5]
MSLEEAVLEKLRVLPKSQKQQVLDFVEFLAVKKHKPAKKAANKRARLLGKYAHLQISLETGDLLEARDEMWGQFPRDIEL